jgi:hypothetical protein
VAEAFDPYLNWLGVPPEEQPAHAYRLLGLAPFDSDPVAIDRAADERMVYVRHFQDGPQGDIAKRVLKEIWAARVTLLDPQKKAAYDAKLRARLEPAAPPRSVPAPAANLEELIAPVVSRPPKSIATRRKRSSLVPMVLRVVGVAAVAAGGFYAYRHFNPPLGTVNVAIPVDDRPGMELRIDGQLVEMPAEDEILFKFRPGKYVFEIRKPNYAPDPYRVEVELVGSQTRTLAPEFRHFPRLVIHWPEQHRRHASVKIDGQERAFDRSSANMDEAPFTLPPGEHLIELDRPGFKLVSQKITLADGQDMKFEPKWEAAPRTAQKADWGDTKTTWGNLPVFQGADKVVVSAFKADPNAPAEKQTEPAPEAQAVSQKRMEEKFNLAKATTADAKLALAKKLAEAAAQPQGDLTDAYVMQRAAAQLFLAAGDLKAAMQSIDKIERAFTIDDLTWRASAVKQFAAGEADAARTTLAVELAQPLFNRYLTQRDFEPATELAAKLNEFCQRGRNRDARKLVVARQSEIERRAANWRLYNESLETLRQKPNDAAANLIVGQWRCLVEGDWKGGLMNLVKSSDPKFQEAGRAEIAGATTPADQAKLGNLWYDMAPKFKNELREGMRKRAGYWYQLAYSRLSDSATKLTVEKRLTELGVRASADQVAANASTASDAKADAAPVVTTANGPLDGRINPLREQLVAAYGSDAEMEAAVDRGLKWLAEHQYADGSWSFSHILAPRCGGKCKHPGELYKCRNAATALTLLAFLGSGNTHVSGPYAMQVTGGITYLAAHMKPTPAGGSLWEPEAKYSHAAATTALCELYAMTHDKRVGAVAQQALLFLCNAQTPSGAWRYEAQESDVTLTSWQVLALRAAHMGRLPVPPQVMKNVTQYFERVKVAAEEAGSLRAEAADKMATASALQSRIYLGWKKDLVTKDSSQLARLGWGEFDFEFNLFATPVMFQCGGIEWTVWSKALRQSLMRTQATEGHEKGSWAILDDPKFLRGGRMYSTCVALLCLEVYYRYLPLYRAPAPMGDKPGKKARTAADPEVQWQPLVSGKTR